MPPRFKRQFKRLVVCPVWRKAVDQWGSWRQGQGLESWDGRVLALLVGHLNPIYILYIHKGHIVSVSVDRSSFNLQLLDLACWGLTYNHPKFNFLQPQPVFQNKTNEVVSSNSYYILRLANHQTWRLVKLFETSPRFRGLEIPSRRRACTLGPDSPETNVFSILKFTLPTLSDFGQEVALIQFDVRIWPN